MTNYLRFLFSPADRDRIVQSSINVTEIPFEPFPTTAADPWPESLQLRFRINDPVNGAPRLRMIFPGDICFLPFAAVSPQIVPGAADVQLDSSQKVTSAAYGKWTNRGRLQIRVNDVPAAKDVARVLKVTGIGSNPSMAWFEPVEIPLDFLNDAVLGGLTHRAVGQPVDQPAIEPMDPRWPAAAIVGFYASRYEAPLKRDTSNPRDPDKDDVVRLPMPAVVMDAAGQVELRITLATLRRLDEIAQQLGTNPLNVDFNHPGNPIYDVIPARVVLQEHRAKIIGATGPIANEILGTNTFITDLKANLSLAGFGKLGPANNDFGQRAQWAVREFQIYSKMATVASDRTPSTAEYALRLTPTANDLVYEGPISGRANAMTRRRLAWWLHPTRLYRCPVVVTARSGTGHVNVQSGGENLWAHNDLEVEAPRMFVRDLSGHYPLAGTTADARDITLAGKRLIILGFYDSQGDGGPNMEAGIHSWQSMAVTATGLTGIDEPTLLQPTNATLWSTYLTVIPTITEESGGRFDVLNAWDNQVISIPLYHYTLVSGELPAFLSYMRSREPAEFEDAVGFFGVKPKAQWPHTTKSQGKHTTELVAVQDGNAGYKPWQSGPEYFKTWHWFYRFVMANRMFMQWRLVSYDFARRRLQDVRAAPMTGRPTGNTAVIPHDAAGDPVTIGAVFTSELANGLLLRWHVYRPRHVVSGAGHADPDELWTAFRRAQTPAENGNLTLDWNLPVSVWTNEHEEALIAGVFAHAPHVPATASPAKLKSAFDRVEAFTRQTRQLSRLRNSLKFGAPPP